MARPQKEGLEYFPLDVDIDQDDKLVVPIAKHGMLGLGVIVRLMMEVYKNGYYYPWTEKELYVFPFKIGVETEKVSEIVIDCINSGFFCNNQYKRNQILTSYGFQKRFLLATTRRKDATINDRYLVRKKLMQTETELLHTETKVLSVESTQKKVKEIESKEIVKEIDITTTPNPFRLFESEGFGTLSSITAEKLGDMIDTYGERWVIEGMKESVIHGVRNLAYLKSILERYRNSGIDKPWESEKPKPKQTTFRNNQPKKDKLPMFKSEEDEPLSPEAIEEIKRKMRNFGKDIGA